MGGDRSVWKVSERGSVPSLRWWSSNSFMASKEAAPARSSWENLASCSLPP